jgi:hypothetical protein
MNIIKTSYKYPVVISQEDELLRFDLLVVRKEETKDFGNYLRNILNSSNKNIDFTLNSEENITGQNGYFLYMLGQFKLNLSNISNVKIYSTFFNEKSIFYSFYSSISKELQIIEMKFSKKDLFAFKFNTHKFEGVNKAFLINSIINKNNETDYRQNNNPEDKRANIMINFLNNKNEFFIKNKTLFLAFGNGVISMLEGFNSVVNISLKEYFGNYLNLGIDIEANCVQEIKNDKISILMNNKLTLFNFDFNLNDDTVILFLHFLKNILNKTDFYTFIENFWIVFIENKNKNKLLLLLDFITTCYINLFDYNVTETGIYFLNPISNISSKCYDIFKLKKETFLLQIIDFTRLLIENRILINYYSNNSYLTKFISKLLNIYNNPYLSYNYFNFFSSYGVQLDININFKIIEEYKVDIIPFINYFFKNNLTEDFAFNSYFQSTCKLYNILCSLNGMSTIQQANNKIFNFNNCALVLNNDLTTATALCFKTNFIIELIKANIDLDSTKRFHPLIALKILNEIQQYKSNVNPALTADDEMNRKILQLLNRNDIIENLLVHKTSGSSSQNLLGNNSIIATMLYENHATNYESEFDLANIKFNVDSRFKEAVRILNPSRALKLNTAHLNNDSSTFEQERFTFSVKNIYKQYSSCIGHGAIFLNTIKTFPKDIITIKPLNTVYISSTDNSTFKLDVNLDLLKDKDFSKWPEFHNGVSQSIKLCTEFFNNKSYIRNWIQFNKPNVLTYEHGGFLYALGLLKQLDSLYSTDIYHYMKLAHDGVTIGILLGRSASKISSMEDALSRTLCLHIAYLIPSNLEINIPVTIQSAASVGLGLLYLGSGNRLMTEMLLEQIGKKFAEKNINIINIESYYLSLGFAVGLINLGLGKGHNKQDLKLEDKLLNFANGGKKIDQSQQINNILIQTKPHITYVEENEVNYKITAVCAYACLTLIFLKTKNQTLANKIKTPKNLVELNIFRPFNFYLALLTKNLIIWDNIAPNEDWIYSQIPEYIRFLHEENLASISEDILYSDKLKNIEFSQISMSYYYCLCAGIMSLGFKFIGTHDKNIGSLIICFINKIREAAVIKELKINEYTKYNDSNKNCINRITLNSCLCICAYALAIVKYILTLGNGWLRRSR